MLALPQWVFTRVLLSFSVFSYLGVILSFTIGNYTIAEEPPMNRQQQCEEYGVYQDDSENWLDCESRQVEETYQEDTYKDEVYVEESYEEDTYSGDSYQEDTYQEDTYQEEVYSD